jgi:MFS family permease
MTLVAAAPAPRGRLRLLAVRDFRLLWIGETTSSLGSSISVVALPLAALTLLHASVLAITVLTAAAWLPWLIVGLPAGAWVDRLPRRRVMLTADLVSLTAFASVPAAAALGWLTITQMLVVALLSGTATVFFATAYRAFLPALLSADDLPEGNAKLQGSEQVTHVAGPGAAGLIAQATSAVGGVIADAASFAVSAACLYRIHVSEPPPATPRRHLRREIAEGLAIVARDPLLRMNAAFGCLSNLVLTGYQAVLVFYLVKVIGLSPGVTGVMLSLTSLGGVHRRHRGRQRHLVRMGSGLLPSPPARAHLDERPGLQLRRHPSRRDPRWPGRQPTRRPADPMDHADRPGTQLTHPAARTATDTPRPAIPPGTEHSPPAEPPHGLTQGTTHHISPEPNPHPHQPPVTFRRGASTCHERPGSPREPDGQCVSLSFARRRVDAPADKSITWKNSSLPNISLTMTGFMLC